MSADWKAFCEKSGEAFRNEIKKNVSVMDDPVYLYAMIITNVFKSKEIHELLYAAMVEGIPMRMGFVKRKKDEAWRQQKLEQVVNDFSRNNELVSVSEAKFAVALLAYGLCIIVNYEVEVPPYATNL